MGWDLARVEEEEDGWIDGWIDKRIGITCEGVFTGGLYI